MYLIDPPDYASPWSTFEEFRKWLLAEEGLDPEDRASFLSQLDREAVLKESADQNGGRPTAEAWRQVSPSPEAREAMKRQVVAIMREHEAQRGRK